MGTEIRDAILDKLGLKGTPVSILRMGRGVLSKTGAPVMVALALCAVVAWKVDSDAIRIGALVIGALVIAYYLKRAFDFSEKNPGAALLEGSDLIAYRQLDGAMMGQGAQAPINLPLSENPMLIEGTSREKPGDDA